MPEISVVIFETIRQVTPSADGSAAIFKATSGGNEVNLSIPTAELQNLLILVLQAMGPFDQNQRRVGGAKRVLPAESWIFGLSPDYQHLVLSFQLQGGSELSFAVHPSVAEPMREALLSTLGQTTTAIPPGTIRQ